MISLVTPSPGVLHFCTILYQCTIFLLHITMLTSSLGIR
jgi:hypothetical protein